MSPSLNLRGELGLSFSLLLAVRLAFLSSFSLENTKVLLLRKKVLLVCNPITLNLLVLVNNKQGLYINSFIFNFSI